MSRGSACKDVELWLVKSCWGLKNAWTDSVTKMGLSAKLRAYLMMSGKIVRAQLGPSSLNCALRFSSSSLQILVLPSCSWREVSGGISSRDFAKIRKAHSQYRYWHEIQVCMAPYPDTFHKCWCRPFQSKTFKKRPLVKSQARRFGHVEMRAYSWLMAWLWSSAASPPLKKPVVLHALMMGPNLNKLKLFWTYITTVRALSAFVWRSHSCDWVCLPNRWTGSCRSCTPAFSLIN